MTTRSTSAASWRIVNNFLHDMATGTWAACVLVIWVLLKQYEKAADLIGAAAATRHHAVVLDIFQNTQFAVFWLLVGALVVVNVTGGIRTAHWRKETAPEELATKRKLLIYKHIAFLVVYGLGSVWAWMMIVR